MVSNNEQLEKHIGVEKAEALTDISRWTWRAMAYKGKISSVKVGRRLLIPISEIERTLKAGHRPAIG